MKRRNPKPSKPPPPPSSPTPPIFPINQSPSQTLPVGGGPNLSPDPISYSPSLDTGPSTPSSAYFTPEMQYGSGGGRGEREGHIGKGRVGVGAGSGEGGIQAQYTFPSGQSTYAYESREYLPMVPGGGGGGDGGGIGGGIGSEARQGGYFATSTIPPLPTHPLPPPLQPTINLPSEVKNRYGMRKNSLRPSASVMSLSLMRKASASTEGGGDTYSIGSSSGPNSPVMSASPSGPINLAGHHLLPQGSGGGGLPTSSSTRNFLMRPVAWLGIGKSKTKHREYLSPSSSVDDGMSPLTLAHPTGGGEKRARGGSSRPGGDGVMGLGIGMGMGMGMGPQGGFGGMGMERDRDRYPAMPATPERGGNGGGGGGKSRMSPLGRREDGVMEERGMKIPVTTSSTSMMTMMMNPHPGGNGPTPKSPGGRSLFGRRQTVGSTDPPEMTINQAQGQRAMVVQQTQNEKLIPFPKDQVSPRTPGIPAIKYNAASQASSFQFQSQPLSPPGPSNSPQRARDYDRPEVASSAPTSKCPTPEPILPRESMDSGHLPRLSIDALRQGGVGLLAASRKPWSKSVDDLGRLFGRGAKGKGEDLVEVAVGVNNEDHKKREATSKAEKRMSWTAREMLKDVSQRDQAQIPLSTTKQERSRKGSGNLLPGPRRKTNSFSGSSIMANASLTLDDVVGVGLNKLGVGNATPEIANNQGRTKATKSSSPPMMMRSGGSVGGGMTSSASTPMLSNLIATANKLDQSAQAEPIRAKAPTPMRAEQAKLGSGDVRPNTHRRSVSANLLLHPFKKDKGSPAHPMEDKPTTPAPKAPIMMRSDSLEPPMHHSPAKRLSQIVHKESLILRHVAPPGKGIKGDDYFAQGPAHGKAWKPFKMVLKGNKAYLYKPPSDKKIPIEMLFPTGLVAESTPHTPDLGISPVPLTPTVGLPSPGAPRTKRLRQFRGITKHPDLLLLPESSITRTVSIYSQLSGTMEALAHEAVFLTQFTDVRLTWETDQPQDDFEEMVSSLIAAAVCRDQVDPLFKEFQQSFVRAHENSSEDAAALNKRLVCIMRVTDERASTTKGRESYADLRAAASTILSLCDELSSAQDIQEAQLQRIPTTSAPDFSIPVFARALHAYNLDVAKVFNDRLALGLHSAAPLLSQLAFGPDTPHPLTKLIWASILPLKGDIVSTELLYNLGLTRENQKNLPACLTFWLELEDQVKRIGDEVSLNAIHQALTAPSILRLDNVWEKVNLDIRHRFRALLSGSQPLGGITTRLDIGETSDLGSTLPEILFVGVRPSCSSAMPVALGDWLRLLEVIKRRDHGSVIQPESQPGFIPIVDIFCKAAALTYTLATTHAQSLAVHPGPVCPVLTDRSEYAPSPASAAPMIYPRAIRTNTYIDHSHMADSIARRMRLSPPSVLAAMDTTWTGKGLEASANRVARRRSLSDLQASQAAPIALAQRLDLPDHVAQILSGLGDNNAPIRIKDDAGDVLLIIHEDTLSSRGRQLGKRLISPPLSRRASTVRRSLSIGSDNHRSSMLIEQDVVPLRATIRSAPLDYLVSALVFGVDGVMSGIDFRKYSLDVKDFRTIFFATYKNFCEPIVVAELLVKAFGAAHTSGPTAAEAALDSSQGAPGDVTQSGQVQVWEVFEFWLSLETGRRDLLDTPGLLQVIIALVEGAAVSALPHASSQRIRAFWAEEVVKRMLPTTGTPSPSPGPVRTNESERLTRIITSGSAEELACALDQIAVGLASKITKFDFSRTLDLFDRQSRSRFGWQLSGSDHGNIVVGAGRIYSLLSSFTEVTEPQNHLQALPASITTYIRAFDLCKDWLIGRICRSHAASDTQVRIIRLLVDTLRKVRLSGIKAASQGLDDSKMPTFACAVISTVLLDPRIRSMQDTWRRVLAVKGRDSSDFDTFTSPGEGQPVVARSNVDLGYLLERFFEICLMFPHQGVDPSIPFWKQRYMLEIGELYQPLLRGDQANYEGAIRLLEALKREGNTPAVSRRRNPEFIGMFAHIAKGEIAQQERDAACRDLLKRARPCSDISRGKVHAIKAQPAPIRQPHYKVADAFRNLYRPASIAQPARAWTAAELDFALPNKPTLIVPVAHSRAFEVKPAIRSHTFSLKTAEGAIYTFQAASSAEMHSWIWSFNKASEEAALRRKTYLPPMPVHELKRDSMNPALDQRNSVYGIPLEVLLERENAGAQKADRSPIPWIAEACMAEIEMRALHEQGLYRIAGAQSERQHLERAFQTGQKVDISSRGRYQDINIVTGAFKGWLSQLPDPVICSNIYHSVVGAMSIADWEERTATIRGLISKLPAPHFDLLYRIMEHLERVLEHEEDNKMTPYNLAVCLSPSLLRAPESLGGRMAIFNDFGPAVKLVMELMQYYRHLLGEEDVLGVGSAPPSPGIPEEMELAQIDQMASDVVVLGAKLEGLESSGVGVVV